MDIDMSALRLLEREREIPLDLLIPTIEQALLVAYHKSPGAFEKARAELDRKSGHVTIWAVEIDDDGAPIGEFEHTPEGFGRIAASTARQIILQRLRDVEDDNVLGEFKGREGELVSGTIQQGNNPHMIQVNLGSVEALLPPPEQVPGEKYIHGNRLRALVIDVHRGSKGPSVTLSRSHPGLVRKLFELEVPEIADRSVEIVALAREAGHRTKIAVKANVPGINAKGACI
ncbi:MAG: NusA N-terminal domain-containing protein, partial [Pseudarthrobacter sp.]